MNYQDKNTRDAYIVAVGDIIILYFSLWVTLSLKGLSFTADISEFILPFSIFFAVWIISFYIAGLYERHTLGFHSSVAFLLTRAHIVNGVIAVVIFYIFPHLEIPITVFVLYLLVSFFILFFWRYLSLSFLRSKDETPAFLIASGEEMDDLRERVNNDLAFRFKFVSFVDLDKIQELNFREDILDIIYSENVRMVVIDLRNENVERLLPHFYNLVFSNIHFIDMHRLYEGVFERIPLSALRYNWFLENISTSFKTPYEIIKRGLDISIGVSLGILSLILYPFIILSLFLGGRDSVFLSDEYIGKNNNKFHLFRFNVLKTSKIYNLRNLPRLWAVVKGDLSLIGPCPEEPFFVKSEETKIPYYTIRYLVKPGLFNWKSLKDYNIDSRTKLSYDLYYIKNRSILLDARIIFGRVKKLIKDFF